MKGLILIMDGMGDRPIKELGTLQIWIRWLLKELQVLWIQ